MGNVANTIPRMKVLFSPQGSISKELSRLIQAARAEIAVAAYAFSSKYLGSALGSALKRGVKIRLILDRDNAERYFQTEADDVRNIYRDTVVTFPPDDADKELTRKKVT